MCVSFFFFFKQKTAYEMRISDWSSDVCSSDLTEIEVARGKQLYRQRFSRGLPLGGLEELGPTPNRSGTSVSFVPDPEIFGEHGRFKPQRLFRMARAKAYLFAGVEIRWKCAPEMIGDDKIGRAHVALQSLMRKPYAGFCWKNKKDSKRTE